MDRIATSKTDLSKSQLVDLYKALLLPRMIERRMLSLLRQGKVSKWFSGIGQEAICVGVTTTLREKERASVIGDRKE